MKLSNIANVIDTEWDGDILLEVGITTVDTSRLELLKSYSVPIKPKTKDYMVSEEIYQLTGWTSRKLFRQGIPIEELSSRLDKHGCKNRLLITDTNDEIPCLEGAIYLGPYGFSQSRINVAILFGLLTGCPENLGLQTMMKVMDLKFKGRAHRAVDDAANIARLFLALIRNLRNDMQQL